ncbi:dienelactone hydrolase family protein [Paenibacillus sp. UMB4589-SE434]|uniref:alpha/beta hydrolase family protein n=1 Tax=Paenibacillus sp. UMB4589-SE434 TaxID=3046314 RepID=UPI00254F7B2E|nr:dienelactone hydrolase family protein [Paenibacillus sp. UMB4589-SE434]MDK8179791.1 dienelactone hydrolase family protein [Paenibacillus sp. UMB4589-SE434]
MRLYEILLVLSSLSLLLCVCLPRLIPQRFVVMISGASTVVLAMHLFMEGYRWQLYAVYVIVVLLLLLQLAKYLFKIKRINIWSPVKWVVCGLLIILIGLSTVVSAYLPVFQLPRPDGPYAVGTQTFHFTDSNREEIFTERKDDKRELIVQFWYPAAEVEQQKTEYLLASSKNMSKQVARAYAEQMGLPGFVLEYWKYVRTNSYENAKVQPTNTPYPVILISHGMGTGRMLHTSQAEHLASQGYIVVAANHTYSSTATELKDGTIAGSKTNFTVDQFYAPNNLVGQVWTKDVEFIIRQLGQLNGGQIKSTLNGKLDLNKIGVMGHSFGGATAFNAFYNNPNIKAGINMDGSLYNVDNKTKFTKPFMFMESGEYLTKKHEMETKKLTDAELADIQLTRPQYENMVRSVKKEYGIVDKVAQHGGTMVVVDGAGHYNFTDLQLYSSFTTFMGMTGDIKGERGADIVNKYVLDFFNKQLKGVGGELIKGPNPQFPEVEFPLD